MNKPVAVIYCRIDENNSEMIPDIIAAQKNSIVGYAKQHGIDIIRYYEDIGYSGCDLERPGIKHLLKDAKDGAFNMVLVYNLDRFFRGDFQTLVIDIPLTVSSIMSGETVMIS